MDYKCEQLVIRLLLYLSGYMCSKISSASKLKENICGVSQVKKKILEEEIHCPPEASVLLASYAVHAKVISFVHPFCNVSFFPFLKQYRRTCLLLSPKGLDFYNLLTSGLPETVTADSEIYPPIRVLIKTRKACVALSVRRVLVLISTFPFTFFMTCYRTLDKMLLMYKPEAQIVHK